MILLPIKLLRRSRLLWHSAIVVTAAAAFTGYQTSIGLHKNHIRPTSSCTNILQADRITGAYLTTQTSLPIDDPRVEPRIMYKVDVSLPLGLTLEDMDSDPSYGVVIVGISPEGNAAKINANMFSSIKSLDNKGTTVSDKCICIRDKIISINDKPCHDKSFDNVVDLISNADANTITLEIGRLHGSTVVNYDNGLCISAKPGENYGFLARKCNVDIDYECRSGACQTCMKILEFPNKRKEKNGGSDIEDDGGSANDIHRRTIFHCIGKVPRGYDWLHVLTGNSI